MRSEIQLRLQKSPDEHLTTGTALTCQTEEDWMLIRRLKGPMLLDGGYDSVTCSNEDFAGVQQELGDYAKSRNSIRHD